MGPVGLYSSPTVHCLEGTVKMLMVRCFAFLFILNLFYYLLQSQIHREKERKRRRSSIRWLSPQVTAMAGADSIQSLLPPGLPCRCGISRLWAVLDGFPNPQARSWMDIRAARILPRAHMGSQYVQSEDPHRAQNNSLY